LTSGEDEVLKEFNIDMSEEAKVKPKKRTKEELKEILKEEELIPDKAEFTEDDPKILEQLGEWME
jgi:hypothetical protein